MGVSSKSHIKTAEQAAGRAGVASRQITAMRQTSIFAKDWVVALTIFLFTRLIALAAAYAGITKLIAAEPARNKGWLAELALNWDAAWYTGIAQHGYSFDPAAPGGSNIAFPPLYPALMRGLSEILGWASFGWDWGNRQYGTLVVAGLLISNLSFLVALILLVRLLSPRLGRARAALVALGLASLPTAFFFSAIYTEGFFLMLVLAAFTVARSATGWKWAAAGLLGMLATLTKFAGLLLFGVLLVEYLVQLPESLKAPELAEETLTSWGKRTSFQEQRNQNPQGFGLLVLLI
ncbi:MAG: hypothetical protein M3014_06895, partial [Chloroflexota bacterium]|nr:hypothetical protein [Chloroflexota bacterium]